LFVIIVVFSDRYFDYISLGIDEIIKYI